MLLVLVLFVNSSDNYSAALEHITRLYYEGVNVLFLTGWYTCAA